MTRAMKKQLSEKMKAVWAAKKTARMTPKEVHESAQPQNEAQQPTVDIRRVEEYNHRRGLLDAIECILREVRHS